MTKPITAEKRARLVSKLKELEAKRAKIVAKIIAVEKLLEGQS